MEWGDKGPGCRGQRAVGRQLVHQKVRSQVYYKALWKGLECSKDNCNGEERRKLHGIKKRKFKR